MEQDPDKAQRAWGPLTGLVSCLEGDWPFQSRWKEGRESKEKQLFGCP